MSIDEIRGAHRARPFRPFWICLADGREIRVPHPEFLAMGDSPRTVIVALPRRGFEIIDVHLITGISFRRRQRA